MSKKPAPKKPKKSGRVSARKLPKRDPKTGRFVSTKGPRVKGRKKSSKPRKMRRLPRDPKTGRFISTKSPAAHPDYRMTAQQALDLYGFDPFDMPDWVIMGIQSGWLPAVPGSTLSKQAGKQYSGWRNRPN